MKRIAWVFLALLGAGCVQGENLNRPISEIQRATARIDGEAMVIVGLSGAESLKNLLGGTSFTVTWEGRTPDRSGIIQDLVATRSNCMFDLPECTITNNEFFAFKTKPGCFNLSYVITTGANAQYNTRMSTFWRCVKAGEALYLGNYIFHYRYPAKLERIDLKSAEAEAFLKLFPNANLKFVPLIVVPVPEQTPSEKAPSEKTL